MARLETRIPPPVWAALVGMLMFALDRLDLGWAAGSTVLGLGAAALGLVIAASGMWEFTRAGTTVDPHRPEDASALVDGGIYRLTRNPMYVGLTLLLVGWGIGLRAPLLAAAGPAVFMVIITRLQIVPEERILRERFGAAYDVFCERTRRWL